MNINFKAIRNLLAATAIAMTAFNANAADAAIANSRELESHNPYTVRGVQIRTELLPQDATSSSASETGSAAGPTLFQEIVPCRFMSTLDADGYPAKWGGDAFKVSESRVYHPTGTLIEGDFVNPCSDRIPGHSVALAVRLVSYKPEGDGSVFLAPSSVPRHNVPALVYKTGNDTLKEATVFLSGAAFAVTAADQPTELTLDVIGYFIPDPNGYGRGDKGEKGETGEKGATGEQGLQGERGAQGEKGDKGDSGAQGLQGERGEKGDRGQQGDRGEQGVQGLQGERGERGESGANGERGEQGPQGEQGLRGEQGAQGLQGEKGSNGERGEQGPQGLRGEKGEAGERGEQGLQGQQGERGAQGIQGERGFQGERGLQGEQGVQGLQGAKGDSGERGQQGISGAKGDQGAQGLQGEKGDKGERGAQGDKGDKGDRGAKGDQGERGFPGTRGITGGPGVTATIGYRVFPPGGSITINDPNAKPDSMIIPLYTVVSNGNAIGIESQGNGSFVATGSPNKPFKYVILNIQ
jgi:hypothetical protein